MATILLDGWEKCLWLSLSAISEFFFILPIEKQCIPYCSMVKRTKAQRSASAKKGVLTRKRNAAKKGSKSKKKR